MNNQWHDAKTDPPKKSGEYLVRTAYGMYRVYAYSSKFEGWNIDPITGSREDENRAVTLWQEIIPPDTIKDQN